LLIEKNIWYFCYKKKQIKNIYSLMNKVSISLWLSLFINSFCHYFFSFILFIFFLSNKQSIFFFEILIIIILIFYSWLIFSNLKHKLNYILIIHNKKLHKSFWTNISVSFFSIFLIVFSLASFYLYCKSFIIRSS
jgi:hypothetical protein